MHFIAGWGRGTQVSRRNYFIRQAATLLRLARETRDPQLAATVLDKAAALTEQADDLTLPEMDVSPTPPDVENPAGP